MIFILICPYWNVLWWVNLSFQPKLRTQFMSKAPIGIYGLTKVFGTMTVFYFLSSEYVFHSNANANAIANANAYDDVLIQFSWENSRFLKWYDVLWLQYQIDDKRYALLLEICIEMIKSDFLSLPSMYDVNRNPYKSQTTNILPNFHWISGIQCRK